MVVCSVGRFDGYNTNRFCFHDTLAHMLVFKPQPSFVAGLSLFVVGLSLHDRHKGLKSKRALVDHGDNRRKSPGRSLCPAHHRCGTSGISITFSASRGICAGSKHHGHERKCAAFQCGCGKLVLVGTVQYYRDMLVMDPSIMMLALLPYAIMVTTSSHATFSLFPSN